MQRRTLVTATAFAATALAAIAVPSWAQSGEIRIAHVYSKTGALEAYGKQTQTGLMMGLEYATGGTMQVAGKKLVVTENDDQGKPDRGKSLLASAYSDDKADIAVGPTSSGVALALLPVAEEYKKILLVEPAAADAITGDKWTNTSSAPAATAARMPSATPWRWTRRAPPSSRWRKTTPLAATA